MPIDRIRLDKMGLKAWNGPDEEDTFFLCVPMSPKGKCRPDLSPKKKVISVLPSNAPFKYKREGKRISL